MSNPRLTEASYIVLGLLEQIEPATPYDLKQLVQVSVVNFWSVPHTQLYAECQRLAESGLLDERRETEGRRRRFYSLTGAGSRALDEWRQEPTAELYEIRDPGTLKLSLGGEPEALAPAQLAAHEAKLEEFEQIAEQTEEMPRGLRLTLELGIAAERTMVEFWSRLAP